MKLITEDIVKRIIKAGKMVVDGELRLPADCVLTPAAMDVVTYAKLKLSLANSTSKLDLDQADCASTCNSTSCNSCTEGRVSPAAANGLQPVKKSRYQVKGGGSLESKPEHMTQLHGNVLVPKDDPRIRLRGEVDLLIAEILKVQVRAASLGLPTLVGDLEEVYAFISRLSHCEVLDEPFVDTDVMGLSLDEVREMSHHPKRFFGRAHLFNISHEVGEMPVLLNGLRASARHCELAFYQAFKEEDGTVARSDLMEGYNRLSSVLYILCLRAVTGQYGELQ